MDDWIMAGIICTMGIGWFALLLRLTRKRGEDCPRYPYDCPCCIHAAECIEIICEKNRRRENVEKKEK